MSLSADERLALLNGISQTVRDNFFNPNVNLADWLRLFEEEIGELASVEDPVRFDHGIHLFLQELNSSHVALFHESGAHVPLRYALHATAVEYVIEGRPTWVFLDVLGGGLAEKAGIVTGDAIIAVSGLPVVPPAQPTFALGSQATLTVSGGNGVVREVVVYLPAQSDSSAPPLVTVPPVSHRRVGEDVGYIAINSFPGDAGIAFARALDNAVRDLSACSKMIFDLRGNIGGGLGSLRLMSYLCPDRRPIGYNLSRKRADRGYRKEDLVRIDRIPFGKLSQLLLFVRFKYLHKDRSIALWTEGLGDQPCHGRIAIIVNEHTKSAAEMVADFASANGLATVVGAQTAGEVLGAVNFRLAHGYKLRIPIGGWITWDDRMIERAGVTPHVLACPSLEDLRAGRDVPLQAAVNTLRSA